MLSPHMFVSTLLFGFPGGYAYINSAAPRLSGDIARLVSEVLQPREQPFCLKFWVNMHGGGLGSLR